MHLGEIDVVGILETTRLLDLVNLVFVSYPSSVNSDNYDNLSYLMSGAASGCGWVEAFLEGSQFRRFAFPCCAFHSAPQQRILHDK